MPVVDVGLVALALADPGVTVVELAREIAVVVGRVERPRPPRYGATLKRSVTDLERPSALCAVTVAS